MTVSPPSKIWEKAGDQTAETFTINETNSVAANDVIFAWATGTNFTLSDDFTSIDASGQKQITIAPTNAPKEGDSYSDVLTITYGSGKKLTINVYVEVPKSTAKVTFDANGGSWSDSSATKEIELTDNKVPTAQVPEQPDNAPSEKQAFKGWFTAQTGGDQITDWATKTFANGDIIWAQWADLYDVTFDPAGGTIPDAVANATVTKRTDINGKVTDVPGDPTMDGYVFQGWYKGTVADANKIEDVSTEKFAADTTLVAGWKELYTITFASDPKLTTGELPASWTQKADDLDWDVINPADEGWAVVTNGKNYYFDGWYVGDEKVTDTTYTPTGNVTMTAQWLPSLALTFDGNKPAGAAEGLTVGNVPSGVGNNVSGADVTIPSIVPTLTGYKFLGWSKDKNASTATWQPNGTFTSITEDTTLYAVWQQLPTITGAKLNKDLIMPGDSVELTEVTLSSGGPVTAENIGGDGKQVKVLEWKMGGTEGNPTSGPDYSGSNAPGASGSITANIPENATGSLWVKLQGDGESVSSQECWVSFPLGAIQLTLNVGVVALNSEGTKEGSTPEKISVTASRTTLGNGEIANVTTFSNNDNYIFQGWTTDVNGKDPAPAVSDITGSTNNWNLGGFDPASPSATGTNSAKLTAPATISTAETVNIYAVYKAVKTNSFTLTLGEGVEEVKVYVNSTLKDTYTSSSNNVVGIKPTDVVTVFISKTETGYDANGFEVNNTDTNYKGSGQTNESLLCNILGSGVTITAQAKQQPKLTLAPTDKTGVLDGTTLTPNGAPTMKIENSGAEATIERVTITGADNFTTTNEPNGSIVKDTSVTITFEPKTSDVTWAVKNYPIVVTIVYTNPNYPDQEFTVSQTVNYTVSNTDKFTGTVTVLVDGSAAQTATVELQNTSSSVQTTDSDGKATFANLTKGASYTATVTYGGKTYTVTGLSDSNKNVTLNLYTVRVNLANESTSTDALGSDGKSVTLTLTATGNTGTVTVTSTNLNNHGASIVVAENTKVTASYDLSVKNGYVFDKWTQTDGGTEVPAENPTVVTKTTVFTAHLKQETAPAFVRYDGNMSKAPGVDEKASYTIPVPNVTIGTLGGTVNVTGEKPVFPGYVFVGWSTNKDLSADDFASDTASTKFNGTGSETVTLANDITGFNSTTNELTLYAIWKSAEITANNSAVSVEDNLVYGTQFTGTADPFSASSDDNGALNYAVATDDDMGSETKATSLPGGLSINATTGVVSGRPYEVTVNDDGTVEKKTANIVITLAEDYHDSDHKVKALVTYAVGVDKATPTVKLEIVDAEEGKSIFTADYTVKVTGPRYTASGWVDDYTDELTFTGDTSDSPTSPTQTQGVGTATFAAVDSSKVTVTEFVTGGDTVVTATFAPRAWGLSGETPSASANFDDASHKQNDVWKGGPATATFTPGTEYELQILMEGETDTDGSWTDNKSWEYKSDDSGNPHAHKGNYTPGADTTTNGKVMTDSTSGAETVNAKQFTLKNTSTGVAESSKLTFEADAFTFGVGGYFEVVESLTSNTLDQNGKATFVVKVKDGLEPNTYKDKLTVKTKEGQTVTIDLTFTVDPPKTYEAHITTLFQTVADKYSASGEAAAAAKQIEGEGVTVRLVPVGTTTANTITIDNNRTWDADNGYYKVDLTTGVDYRVQVTGTAGNDTTYTIPSLTVTSNNSSAEITMYQVALDQHANKKGDGHVQLAIGSLSGAGWYVNGQMANISAPAEGTVDNVNYVFATWMEGKPTMPGGTCSDSTHGTNNPFAVAIDSAVQFNAHYDEKGIEDVTLTYEPNVPAGETANVTVPSMVKAKKNADETFTISTATPSRPGYIFRHWVDSVTENTNSATKTINPNVEAADAVTYAPGAVGPARDKNYTLYAIWDKIQVLPPHDSPDEGKWSIGDLTGAYGKDFAPDNSIPLPTTNAGKIASFALSATTDGKTTMVDDKTITTVLPGGLELDETTGQIVGIPYQVTDKMGPYVLKASHELGDDLVAPLYSEPFYITVNKYQLQFTPITVTDAVIGQTAETATYEVTVAKAPFYIGKDSETGKDVWDEMKFTETVVLQANAPQGNPTGTLTVVKTEENGTKYPTFTESTTTVTLNYAPSTKAADKDGNGSTHAQIYVGGDFKVDVTPGGTYTMELKETHTATENCPETNKVNQGDTIEMWGPDVTQESNTVHQGGFVATVGAYDYAVNGNGIDGATAYEGPDASAVKNTVNGQQFTLINTGNQAVAEGALGYKFGTALEKNKAGVYFELVGDLSGALAANTGETTFIVVPKAGLEPGEYTDTLTISNPGGGSATVKLKFTVTQGQITLKVTTYLWDKENTQGYKEADETSKTEYLKEHVIKNIDKGAVVLVNTTDDTKPSPTSTNATDGEYVFANVDYGQSYFIKVNGYTVVDKTTRLPKILNRENLAEGVYLYKVETAFYPNEGTDENVAAKAAPTVVNSVGNEATFVVHGETATITVNDVANEGYTYKELRDTTETAAPGGGVKTSGKTYTTEAVTNPVSYTAIYTKSITLTYQPNGGDVKVTVLGGTETAAAEPYSKTYEPGSVVAAISEKEIEQEVAVDLNDTKICKGWTREKYTFVGWSTVAVPAENDKIYAVNEALDLNALDTDSDNTVTLYAIWKSSNELTLKVEDITVAYKEAIDNLYAAEGGQGDYTYTATTGEENTLVNSGSDLVPDIAFTDGGATGDKKDQFTIAGTSEGKPTDEATEIKTPVSVTVTDGNEDKVTASFNIIQIKAPTEIKEGFTGVDNTVKAGDDFDFTKLTKPDTGLVVEAKKADGNPNAAIDFIEPPADKDGNTTPETGKYHGKWSVQDVSGKPITKFLPGENDYYLVFTPDDEGFLPTEPQKITLTLEKKIAKVIPNFLFPVDKAVPVTNNGTFEADTDVVNTTKSPEAKKDDAQVVSIVWPDGLDGDGKFDRSKDITVYVTVKPLNGWVFDASKTENGAWNFTAEFHDMNVAPDGPAANVTATVITCSETEAILTYTWKAEAVGATNILVQVEKPVNGGTPNKTSCLAEGTPAGSFTAKIDKWVRGNVNGTPAADDDNKQVTSENYDDDTALPALADNATFKPGKYVVIVTAKVNEGYYFNAHRTLEGDDEETLKNSILAALDRNNEYAKINGMNARVLKEITDASDATKATEVTLAVEFTVEKDPIVSLTADPAVLAYYEKTGTDEGKNKHFELEHTTGRRDPYGFTLEADDVTIYGVTSGSTGNKTKLSSDNYILFVDQNDNGVYDEGTSGDTLLGTKTTDESTGTKTITYNVRHTFTNADLHGKKVYAAYLTGNGTAEAKVSNQPALTAYVGTLTVKPLEAKSIAASDAVTDTADTGWYIDKATNQFKINSTESAKLYATVNFNTGDPMVNKDVAVTYAERENKYGLTAPAAPTGDEPDYRPNFFFMLDANNDGKIDDVEVEVEGNKVKDSELKDQTQLAVTDQGKGVYACYTDVNGNLVYTKVGAVGVKSDFTVDVTDENGQDPEYGDKLTADPKIPNPEHTPGDDKPEFIPAKPSAPDKPFTYQWEKLKPGTDPTAPDNWEKIPGATSPDYRPDKEDVGDTIRVVVTDPGSDTSIPSDGMTIEKRSINFTVDKKDKKWDDTADNKWSYVYSDFHPTKVTATQNFTGNAPTLDPDTGKPTFTTVTTAFGGVWGGDEVSIIPAAAGWNSADATRPPYLDTDNDADASDVGSKITWPEVTVDGSNTSKDSDTKVSASKISDYMVLDSADGAGDTASAYYRLAPQDKQTDRGVITDGTVTHVDVSFKEVPTFGHKTLPVMGVTDKRETRAGEAANDDDLQTYQATWYEGEPADDFDPADPKKKNSMETWTALDTVSSGNTGAKTYGANIYTVVVQVKPQAGYNYNLTDNTKETTKFYFHFGELLHAEVDTTKGLKVDGDVYYMWYTFTAVTYPKIAQVNVSIPQPVVDKTTTEVGDPSVSYAEGEDGSNLTNYVVVPGSVSWNLAGDKFAADTEYTLTFDVTVQNKGTPLSGYEYVNDVDNTNYVKFIVGSSSPINGEGTAATTPNVIKSVVTSLPESTETGSTTYSAASNYHVVVTFEKLTGGKVPLTDVYVNAPIPKAGVHADDLSVDTGKPYELTGDNNKWYYWTGSAWTPVVFKTTDPAVDAAGVDDSGNFLPGYDYRAIATVKLTTEGAKKYTISTGDTTFYLAGEKRATDAAPEEHQVNKEMQLTANTNSEGKLDGTFTLIREFSIPANYVMDVSVTYPEPKAGSAPVVIDKWDYLTLTGGVIDQDLDDTTAAVDKDTKGTKWYTTSLTEAPTNATFPTTGTPLAGDFADGAYYLVKAVITPETGKAFVTDKTDETENTLVHINNIPVHVGQDMQTYVNSEGEEVGWAKAEADGNNIIAYYISKTPTVDRTIVSVDAAVAAPAPAGTPATSFTVDTAYDRDNRNVKQTGITASVTNDVTWKKIVPPANEGAAETQENVTGDFEMGEVYEATFTIKTANSYVYKEDMAEDGAKSYVTFKINGVDVTVTTSDDKVTGTAGDGASGPKVTVTRVEAATTPTKIDANTQYTVKVRFPATSDLTPIEQVTVDYTVPTMGGSPAKSNIYTPTAQVKLGAAEGSDTLKYNDLVNDRTTGSTWFDASTLPQSGNGLNTTGVTFDDGDYVVLANFTAKTGFKFTDSTTFTVNGTTYKKEATNSHVTIADDGSTATVWHTFPGVDKEIVKVVTAVDAPVATKTPQAKPNTTVAANKDNKNLMPDALVNADAANIKWYVTGDAEKGTVTTFGYDTKYTAEFVVETADDYKFQAVAADAGKGIAADYVDFFVNAAAKEVNNNVTSGDSKTTEYTFADGTKVTLTKDGSSDNKYTVTIDFPATGADPAGRDHEIVSVHSFVTAPVVGAVPSKADITDKAQNKSNENLMPNALTSSGLTWTETDGGAPVTVFEYDKKYTAAFDLTVNEEYTYRGNNDFVDFTINDFISLMDDSDEKTLNVKNGTGNTTVTLTWKNNTLDDTSDDVKITLTRTPEEKDGDKVTVREKYTVTIDFPAIPSDKTIVRVAANATQPVSGGVIADAGVNLIMVQDKYGKDQSTKVTLGAPAWEMSADGSTNWGSAGANFEKGKYYRATFTVTANDVASGYKFLADTVADPDDYVDFLINSVIDPDTDKWIDGEKTDVTSAISTVKVTTAQIKEGDPAAKDTNKYTVTVTFPKTEDKADVLTVFGLATEPKAGNAINIANITVPANELYEIKSATEDTTTTYEKEWQHWELKDPTDPTQGYEWKTASGNFVPGDKYRAVLTVVMKTDKAGKYQFTAGTEGYVNTDEATNTTTLPTTDSDATSLVNTANTTITLAKVFQVPLTETEVHVSSTKPTAGATVADVNTSIKVPTAYAGKYELVTAKADSTALEKAWYDDKDGTTETTEFKEKETYYLIVNVKPKAGYKLPDTDAVTRYIWDEEAGNRPTVTENGDGSYKMVFEYRIPGADEAKPVSVIPGNANQPVNGKPLDTKGWTSDDFTVEGNVTWYEGAKKLDDITGTTPKATGNAKEETVYTAVITVKPKDGVTVGGTLTYTFNGKTCETSEYKDNGDGTYTLSHTFDKTGKTTNITQGGGGGGGTTTVDIPVVTYALLDKGVTKDLTAEKVKKDKYPQNVPEVTGIKGLHFVGWSETDPSTLKDGKLPTLVDPTTVKITKDKTFYAVYEEVKGEYDHTHYVIGFPNGTFAPDAKITRAEVATIIARSCLDGFVEGGNYGNPGNYTDVSEHWAFSAISYCSKNGVFNGYEDNTFRPDRYITRQELATVVARLAGIKTSKGLPFKDSADVASWALNGVYTAYENGWVNGYEDNTFRPLNDITRAETVKIFNGYLVRGVNKDGLIDMKEYVHTGVASNNTENGHDEYMTWPDVPKTHWAYYEIIEAANDHNYHWLDETGEVPPEKWEEVYINEKWRYNDNANDGAENRDENMNAQKTFTVTYLVSSNGVTYDAITETVERFASPDPKNQPVAVPNQGYRFAGWSTTDPSTGTVNLVDPTAISVTEDKWYYAVFEEDKPYELPKFTVTYVIGTTYGNYSGPTVETVEMYQAPSVSFLPQPTTQEGWYLAGWSETDPASGSYTIVDPTANYITGDKTFYAVYSTVPANTLPIYTVKYVIGSNGTWSGATTEQVEMYQAPSPSVLPRPTAKQGYQFIGWSETDPATGNYTIVDPTANYVTGDKTFYAVYAAQ